jgi:hypothetical protein
MQIMPYDDVDFSRVLDACLTRGFLVKYASGTEEYGWIPTFLRHQIINNREKASELPDPCDATTSTRAPRVPHACPTRLVQDQGEGKGREGNKEGNGKEQEAPSAPVVPAQLGEWEVRPGFLIPESLRNEACRSAINDWLSYKKESRQTYKETGLRVALKQWGETFTSSDFPEAVAASISAGYRGIFPPNRNAKTSPRRSEDKQIQENIPIPFLTI